MLRRGLLLVCEPGLLRYLMSVAKVNCDSEKESLRFAQDDIQNHQRRTLARGIPCRRTGDRRSLFFFWLALDQRDLLNAR